MTATVMTVGTGRCSGRPLPTTLYPCPCMLAAWPNTITALNLNLSLRGRWLASLLDEREAPGFLLDEQDERKRDLRSASVPYKRDATRGEKYYHFKGVKAGDLEQSSYTVRDCAVRVSATWLHLVPTNREEAKIETWIKESLFRKAKDYPRPPTHHHHCISCNEGRMGWRRRHRRDKEVKRMLSGSSGKAAVHEEWIVNEDVWWDFKRWALHVKDGPGVGGWLANKHGEWELREAAEDNGDDVERVLDLADGKTVEQRTYQIAEDLVDRAVCKWKDGAAENFPNSTR